MRFAVSGSSGTGKSTLAEELSRILNVPRVGEGVREYLEAHNITHLRELTPQGTMEMQNEIFMTKYVKEKSLREFVADRCTADNVAYALRWCARDVDPKEVHDYVNKLREHCREMYDLVFFLPWGSIPLEDDGIRSSKPLYQYEMSCLIKGILIDWEVPFYIVRSQSLDDRINECLDVIFTKES